MNGFAVLHSTSGPHLRQADLATENPEIHKGNGRVLK